MAESIALPPYIQNINYYRACSCADKNLPWPVRVYPLLNKQSYQKLQRRQSGLREQVLKRGTNFRQETSQCTNKMF